MGIHYFYGKWVSKLGATVNTAQLPSHIGVEGVLFDLNGLLHKVAQRIYLYGNAVEQIGAEAFASELRRALHRTDEQAFNEYARSLTMEMNHVVSVLKPRQYLFVAVDGVAPGAKIAQQRARRYGAAAGALSGAEQPPANDFTSSLISPGTIFMTQIDTVLRAWISRAQRASALPKIVYYSSHTVPGEGEHKMFGMLRDLFNAGQIAQGRGAHVVYGMDSDLMVLGMCSPVRNIYLSREDLHQNVNIDALFGEIRKDMTAGGRAPTASFDSETLRRDFAVVATLVGNDFLPNSPAYMTMATEQIFMAYRTLPAPLTFESEKVRDRPVGSINLHSFALFFSALASYEPALLIDAAESELRDQKTRRRRLSPSAALLSAYDFESRSLNIPRLRSAWYSKIRQIRSDVILTGRTATVEQLREALGPGRALVQRVVCDYVASIAWVLRYYTGGGDAVNWLFAYRYLLAPLAADVAAVLKPQNLSEMQLASGLDTLTALAAVEFWEKQLERKMTPGPISQFGPGPGNGAPAIAPVHQLLAITPPSRIEKVIGVDRLAALIKRGGAISYIAPNPGEYEMFTEGKTADYLAVPILPEVDLLQIVDAVQEASREFAEESMAKQRVKIAAAIAKDIEDERPKKRHQVVYRRLVPIRLSYASYDEPEFLSGAFVPPSRAAPVMTLGETYASTGRALGEPEYGRWGVGTLDDLKEDENESVE